MVDERWLKVAEPGFEDLYEVSNHGGVRSLPRQTARGVMGGKVLKTSPHPKGYRGVTLSGHGKRRPVLVHKLVLEAFARKPKPGEEARHLNGNPADNRWPENLSWSTHPVNEQDKKRHGTDNPGERNPMAKLEANQVLDIIRRNAAGESQRALASEYKISQPQVSRLITGKRWAHLRATL